MLPHMHTSRLTISRFLRYTRNVCHDCATRPQIPETMALWPSAACACMRRKKGDVVKPRQNLPRICQGEPGPEARTKKILIDGALSQVRKLTPAPQSWHGHAFTRPHANSCDFSATPGAPARPARLQASVPSGLFSPC